MDRSRTGPTALGLHRPISTTASAAVASWLGLLLLNPSSLDARSWLWPALGILYTHAFEYLYHRYVLHRGLRTLRSLQKGHGEHHRRFHGRRFATRDPEDLQYVAGHPLLFPAALGLHYLVLRFVLDAPALVWFLGGVLLHYLVFELTHWFAHVHDNDFDRVLTRLPVLGYLRDVQLRHHRLHHETPEVDFNFNPPFAGDFLSGTLVVPADCHSRRELDVDPEPCFRKGSWELVTSFDAARTSPETAASPELG